MNSSRQIPPGLIEQGRIRREKLQDIVGSMLYPSWIHLVTSGHGQGRNAMLKQMLAESVPTHFVIDATGGDASLMHVSDKQITDARVVMIDGLGWLLRSPRGSRRLDSETQNVVSLLQGKTIRRYAKYRDSTTVALRDDAVLIFSESDETGEAEFPFVHDLGRALERQVVVTRL